MGHDWRAQVSGPLASYADGYRRELQRLGYTAASTELKVSEMSHLSRWLEGNGLCVGDVGTATVQAFLTDWGPGRRRTPTLMAMRPLLGWLLVQGVIASDPAATREALDELLAEVPARSQV